VVAVGAPRAGDAGTDQERRTVTSTVMIRPPSSHHPVADQPVDEPSGEGDEVVPKPVSMAHASFSRRTILPMRHGSRLTQSSGLNVIVSRDVAPLANRGSRHRFVVLP
jgi:hypothetical protein